MAPFTDTERLALRDRLLDERERMSRQLAGLQGSFAELVESTELQPPDDEHDPDATTAYARAKITSLVTAPSAQLASIDRALLAVEDGRYGACSSCRQPIGVERQEALPAARTCVTCAATGREAKSV